VGFSVTVTWSVSTFRSRAKKIKCSQEIVLMEGDFLASDEIKAHFTGEHVKYPVENCQLVC
jgi:hypothetical protein